MTVHRRCDECGSWGEECASETVQPDCACARCANARVRVLEAERDEARAEVERLNEVVVKQHLAYATLMGAYTAACDVAQHNYKENERVANQACGWAFDAGLALVSGVRCYWCKENLGNDEKDILAHVAQCRNGIMGMAS